jgi:hypothetical protein
MMTMTTTMTHEPTPPPQRRNPPNEPAPMTGTPPTQRTTASEMTVGTPPMTTAMGATTTMTEATINSLTRPLIS